MDSKEPTSPLPERLDTDTSLREEREKTDRQLASRRSVIEKDADQVIELARGRADDVLEDARQKEDATVRFADQPVIPSDAVDDARTSEDEALTEERAVADDQLSRERAEQRRAIAQLLRLEREETDERLSAERAHSDRAVASRDDFLAMVSHDVRGMLAVIATSTDLLMRTPNDGPAGAHTDRGAADPAAHRPDEPAHRRSPRRGEHGIGQAPCERFAGGRHAVAGGDDGDVSGACSITPDCNDQRGPARPGARNL